MSILFAATLEVQMNNVKIGVDEMIPVGTNVTYRCKYEDGWKALEVSKQTCRQDSPINGEISNEIIGTYCGIYIMKYISNRTYI